MKKGMHSATDRRVLARTFIRIEPKGLEATILVVFKINRSAEKLSAKTRTACEDMLSNNTTLLAALMRKNEKRLIKDCSPAGAPERTSSTYPSRKAMNKLQMEGQ